MLRAVTLALVSERGQAAGRTKATASGDSVDLQARPLSVVHIVYTEIVAPSWVEACQSLTRVNIVVGGTT